MQKALDAQKRSKHPQYKVAALIRSTIKDNHYSESIQTNDWPQHFINTIGTSCKLGNSSTTIHAEVNALLNAKEFFCQNASIYITDLPCPNCAKMIVASGIHSVYIDFGAYNSLLGQKIRPFYDTVSALILQSAGCNIFTIDMDQESITRLFQPSTEETNHRDEQETLTHIPDQTENLDITFVDHIKSLDHSSSEGIAACLAKDPYDNMIFLSTTSSPSEGLDNEHIAVIQNTQKKYEPVIRPLNALLSKCAKHGLSIVPNYIYSRHTPTSREFVNIIGADCSRLFLLQPDICRDPHGQEAKRMLEQYGIIELIDLK